MVGLDRNFLFVFVPNCLFNNICRLSSIPLCLNKILRVYSQRLIPSANEIIFYSFWPFLFLFVHRLSQFICLTVSFTAQSYNDHWWLLVLMWARFVLYDYSPVAFSQGLESSSSRRDPGADSSQKKVLLLAGYERLGSRVNRQYMKCITFQYNLTSLL